MIGGYTIADTTICNRSIASFKTGFSNLYKIKLRDVGTGLADPAVAGPKFAQHK